ncbi:kinase domain protein, putative (macronuclear) [Tetrahymena thermophila SB210]|uniref:Kinase domain protein, putative n=1 Tax=Tetrahymena thermophila (strain SB210) TaxID=312017 RepID=Q23S29_TETTS|nr:kinase domain protein, putative [Tetrahymena thermophila SB210]EAR99318.1 kinase domain protein, putative [Tetrahymena thermophila SB210]|eukprot:XP_001019563.1 kinase domain protein, putative [Tetrahymena thermophila SB210]
MNKQRTSKQLNSCGCYVSQSNTQRLHLLFAGCTKLTNLELILGKYCLGKNGLSDIIQGLEKCANLSSLQLDLSEVQNLFSSLTKISNLQILGLKLIKNYLDVQDQSILSQSLANCQTLTDLRLTLKILINLSIQTQKPEPESQEQQNFLSKHRKNRILFCKSLSSNKIGSLS